MQKNALAVSKALHKQNTCANLDARRWRFRCDAQQEKTPGVSRFCSFRFVGRAARAAIGPGPHHHAERRLRPRRRRASAAGHPSPAHQAVRRHVAEQRNHIPATVPRRILDLPADRAKRTPLPAH
jgi:hypothetical protein